jgi:hypothetical protein
MMATTLLCLSSFYEAGHTLEYFICSSQMLEYEMSIMDLQKPMIEFVLLGSPVPLLSVFGLLLTTLYFDIAVFLCCF